MLLHGLTIDRTNNRAFMRVSRTPRPPV